MARRRTSLPGLAFDIGTFASVDGAGAGSPFRDHAKALARDRIFIFLPLDDDAALPPPGLWFFSHPDPHRRRRSCSLRIHDRNSWTLERSNLR